MDPTSVTGGRGHRALPHTADIALRAWAPTLEGCLAEAVIALTDSFLDVAAAVPTRRRRFRVTGRSPEQQLVALLEEMLFRLDARGEVVVGASVDPVAGDVVTGWFDVVDAAGVAPTGSAPKGVSLSGLDLRPGADGWSAEVTVDV